jgi:ribose/xylose/arabinose/galactoside ABC-type transport system permease subunit
MQLLQGENKKMSNALEATISPGRKIIDFFLEYSVAIILALIIMIMSVVTRTFLTRENLANVIRIASINGIMACGMTFLLICSGFDLSIGMNMSLTGLLGIMLQPVIGVGPAIVVALLAGICIGIINGSILVLINGGMGETLIITLGMQSVVYGIGQLYSQGKEIRSTGDPVYDFFGKGTFFGIPFPIILFICIAIICHFLLSYTGFGRRVFLIGGNKKAARLAGIRIGLYRILVFGLVGFTAAIAGIVLSSRVAGCSARMGTGYEFDVISAVVIGGTSLLGGEGSIIKTFFGVILMSIIANSLNLLGIPSQFQYVAKGIVILLAVGIDVLRKLKGGK